MASRATPTTNSKRLMALLPSLGEADLTSPCANEQQEREQVKIHKTKKAADFASAR